MPSPVFLITVPATIVVTGAQSIDGSDGGKNDVAILGGPLSQHHADHPHLHGR